MARDVAAQTAWLARTIEMPLEPELEIVDPHHHRWDHAAPPYRLDDLLADTAAGHNVTATVFIECGWAWDRDAAPEMIPVSETARVAELAAQSARRGGAVIAKIVGHADLRLGGEAAGRALDALQAAGGMRFVGIRHATAWDADPNIPNHRTDPAAGLMGDPTWRAGFTEVAKRNLTYDAWLYHPQIPEFTALARAFPETTMILDHLGGPLGVRGYRDRTTEVRAECRESLAELATCPNVNVKLGGIGMSVMGGDWQRLDAPPSSETLAGYWRDHIGWIIDTFGVERCMFESNFPVDRETCNYVVLWNAFKRIAADASPAEKAGLFAGTAKAVYGIA